jgi:hypothetical protein
MGNYNCKDCLEKNASSINEMLINTELFRNESDQDITRNTRSDRLKILRSTNTNQNNEIINVEKNINKLRKEERDNNILLKNELNKIKDIDIEVQKINNSNEVNKLIEKQRKKILEQKKIIDEYKTKESLYEKQKEEMEQTQKMIRQQQSLLDKQEQEIENKRTHIVSRKQLKISSPKIKNFPTEMSDKKKIKKEKEKEREKSFTKNNYNIPKIKKFERTQVIKPHFINSKEITKQNIKKETLDSENQIEENDNYEKIEVYDDEDQSRNFHHQSQKFKIETYEPIEPGSKNDNDMNSNYNELNNIILEPRDSSRLNTRKDTTPRTKKKEASLKSPRDSGKNGININFRGTFENKENKENKKERKKSEKVEQIFYGNLEPRDSKRKDNIEFNFNSTNANKNNNNNINDYLIQKNNDNNNNDNNNENINEVLIQSEEQNINIFGDNNNNNIDNINNNSIDNNNIYFSKEYNINLQQESPKFNYGYNEDINSSIKSSEKINTEMERYRNAETYGPYLNEVENINVGFSAPIIFQKDLNYDNGNNNYNLMENNNLIYSEEKIGTNFFGN